MQPRYISALPSADFIGRPLRRLCILGSTGSIGQSALRVVDEQPNFFAVIALAAGKNHALLARQAMRYRPSFLAVQDDTARRSLQAELASLSVGTGYRPEILTGQDGYAALAALEAVDMVLSAQVGAAGLYGTFAALRAGKTVALANKESLVLAGDLIRAECCRQMHERATGKRHSCCAILPVDSEHNAIFQCLAGQNALGLATVPWGVKNSSTIEVQPNTVSRLILTASGGPFRGKSASELQHMRKEDALAHPVWNMGTKISIDSATMMNKGLEVIEACHLFGLPQDRVDVLIHPQSIIHSFVEYGDHSRLAQMGVPDMRIPIACCLGWPHRITSGVAQLALSGVALTFEEPDTDAFPALELCRRVFEEGKGCTVALNAANETAVELFLQDRLSFPDITRLCEKTLASWNHSKQPDSLEEVLVMDGEARRLAQEHAASL